VRFRDLTIREILGILVLPVIIVLALIAPAYVTNRVNQIQLEVSCQTARANIQQLQALRAISHELGIPVGFTVPAPPPECVDFSAP
jgi:hypothetical protein